MSRQGVFSTFKIDISKEKKNGASDIDIVAFKMFNKSNERTLTSCYSELAHVHWQLYLEERKKVLFLSKQCIGKLKSLIKEKTNVIQSRPKASRSSSKKSGSRKSRVSKNRPDTRV